MATLAKNINIYARSMFDGTLASASKYPFQQRSESTLNVVYFVVAISERLGWWKITVIRAVEWKIKAVGSATRCAPYGY